MRDQICRDIFELKVRVVIQMTYEKKLFDERRRELEEFAARELFCGNDREE